MSGELNGKRLIEALDSIKEPANIEAIVKAMRIKDKRPEAVAEARNRVKTFLDAAVKMGFVKKCHGHYYTSKHIDEMVELIKSESSGALDSEVSATSIDESSGSEDD
ncbi:hypothetical protein KR018_012237 [Drosophila ironensis]|nr:hypothetical protein KR018_012237 [Drosophila ironensis]